NFSSLNLVFLLERDPGYYLIHMYLPLTLTVLMSWHALWFKVEIPQARMVLSVNCLFTAVTVANDARSSIPRVSYLKMADVWITACILFIYGLILVSSMVNYMSRMKLRPIIMRRVDQGLGDMWHVSLIMCYNLFKSIRLLMYWVLGRKYIYLLSRVKNKLRVVE
ncbi:unnamed protein product, partial [Ixodes pacificus]